MTYTAKNLAKMSGVTVRTLHWYDEINLLKPAFIADNGYRMYGEEQLFRLQQILFYKELGFKLSLIQSLLNQEDFDTEKALLDHRNILEKDIHRKRDLIQTIDKTLARLKGESPMRDHDLFKGFDPSKQKEYEQYLVEYKGLEGERLLQESRRRTAKWDKDELDDVKALGEVIHKDLAHAIDQRNSPDSDVVQAIIARHYHMVERFYHPTKEVYIGLAQLYVDHPDFKKFFDAFHPDMLLFIGKAMGVFAERNL